MEKEKKNLTSAWHACMSVLVTDRSVKTRCAYREHRQAERQNTHTDFLSLNPSPSHTYVRKKVSV